MINREFLGPQFGLTPERGKESFNNILYLLEYLVARQINGTLTSYELDLMRRHFDLTVDSNGLYTPKNSHDNLTAKLCACLIFHFYDLQDMKLSVMLKQVWYRPWDAAFYIYYLAPKPIRWILKPLIYITFIQIAIAIIKKHKVRPKLHERILWTLQGKAYKLRRMQNDGKILGLIKLITLKGAYPRITRFLRGLYLRYVGPEYGYTLMYNYFYEKDHPVILEWRQLVRTGRDPLI